MRAQESRNEVKAIKSGLNPFTLEDSEASPAKLFRMQSKIEFKSDFLAVACVPAGLGVQSSGEDGKEH